MRERFWKSVLLVLGCLSFAGWAQPYFDLQKIDSPQLNAVKIINIQSDSDFWVLDQRGILFHFTRGSWRAFPVPDANRLTGFNAVAAGTNVILVSGFDENWRTKLFWLRNGQWQKDTLQLTTPVKELLALPSGNIYLAGDWATFYRYQKGSWQKIPLPFYAHFKLFYFSEKEMYLATRGQGLFKYDGKQVVSLPINSSTPLEIIKVRKDSVGTLFFSSFNGQAFRWDGRIFRKTDLQLPDTIQYSFQYIRWRNIKIPNLFRIRQIVPLKPQGALLVSSNGQLYRLKSAGHARFLDFTEKYHLNRLKDMPINGAFFYYWNNDNYPDLYLMSNAPYAGWRFYVNQPNRPFEDITHQIGFRPEQGDYLSLPIDLNNDGRSDLAVLQLSRQGNRLKYFFQDSDHRFRNFAETSFSSLKYSRRTFKSLYAGDFDGNGLIDLGLSTYFNRKLKKGSQIFLHNHFQALRMDTVFLPRLARHYTAHAIWSDLTGDGENDLLLINQWDAMNILLRQPASNTFVPLELPGKKQDAPAGAAVFDYDNDGDLDILYSSAFYTLRLLTNQGQGEFDDTFQPSGFSALNKMHLALPIYRFITVLDVNNDGFEDVLFCLNDPDAPRNYLFLNQQGIDFVEEATAYGLTQPVLRAAISADVDRDGDMDIFGYNAQRNVLWINNLDGKNFLEITVQGVPSNRSGLGCQLWVYRTGHLNQKDHLIAYRQLPNATFIPNLANQLFFHVGLPDSGLYDLRLQFYHGRSKVLRRVAPGSFLHLKENGPLVTAIYGLPAVFLHFFAWRENQIYVLLTLLMGVVLFYSIRFASRRLAWKQTASLIIALYMITVYWITLLATMKSSSIFYKYLLPPGAVMVNLIFLLTYSFFNLQHWFGRKHREQLKEELLKQLLIFNHGQAGSRNLIALQLLLNNPPDAEHKLPEFKQLLERRFQIFKDYNIPALRRVQTLLQELNQNDLQWRELEEKLSFLEKADLEQLERLREEINHLYTFIRRLKEEQFRKFSCDPEKVILQLVDLLPKTLNVSLYKNYQGQVRVFIKREDLYFVLDNLLHNARRAVQNLSDGYVRIALIKRTPGLIIQVRNNGPEIPAEIKEQLFSEKTNSKKGRGMGLAYSKKILEKYQAKIRLELEQGQTVFSVELRELI